MKNGKVKLAKDLKIKKITEEEWKELDRLSDEWGKSVRDAFKKMQRRLTDVELHIRLD